MHTSPHTYANRSLTTAPEAFYSDEIVGEEDDEIIDVADLLPPQDLSFLRDFIVASALYVEQLEGAVAERSDEFWEMREHAYRIITGLLIDLYRIQVNR